MTSPPRRSPLSARRNPLSGVVVVAGGLGAGGVARLAGAAALADAIWAASIVVVLAPLSLSVLRALLRRETGVDAVALLAMTGALALGEYLAGAVIALMMTGGQALERRAGARAARELSGLLARAPRTAHRRCAARLETVPVDDVRVGDRLVVKSGELVPVDALVTGLVAVLDESALTGESRPVERRHGERVASGVVNAGAPLELRAIATAADSTYAGIVRLVRQARTARAPLVRLADRYALVFLPVTLTVAAAAWLLSGDPVRGLAVLVVATPCPLILAAPIAITSGVSRAARRGVIVKGGAALETLARARTLLVDKTGTLTAGRPRVAAVETFGGLEEGELLRLAASVEQVSAHVFAPSIVRAAHDRGLDLAFPTDVSERPGAGTAGTVDGVRVALGTGDWVAGHRPLPTAARALRRRARLEGSSAVFVAVGGSLAGALLLDDPVRPEAPRAVRSLRSSGVERVVMLTGDRPDVAQLIASAVGADQLLADRTPAQKLEAVRAARSRGPAVMVGDGVNDAPALAVADVGVAMGARGASASSEAADVVVMVDRLDRVAEAMDIAGRSRRIALQSVLAGMGLSAVAMAFAAAGLLAPVAGALVQETIDLAVIANALRALRDRRRRPAPEAGVASARFRGEHRDLLAGVEHVRTAADRLGRVDPASAPRRAARPADVPHRPSAAARAGRGDHTVPGAAPCLRR